MLSVGNFIIERDNVGSIYNTEVNTVYEVEDFAVKMGRFILLLIVMVKYMYTNIP